MTTEQSDEHVGKVSVHVLLDATDVKDLDRIRRETGESVSGLIRRLVKGFIRSKSAGQPSKDR